MARGVWTHAVVGFLLAIFTWGLSWFIYPFCANRIMRTHYLRRGWLEFREFDGDAPTSPSDPAAPVPPGDGWVMNVDQKIARYAEETAQRNATTGLGARPTSTGGFGKRRATPV